MNLFSILTDTSTRKVFFSLLFGIIAGVGFALLIPLVTNSFTNNDGFEVLSQAEHTFFSLAVTRYKFAELFLFTCLVVLIARTTSQVLLTWVVIEATSKLRKRYYQAIFRTPLIMLEKVGYARLITSITTDVQRIVSGAQRLPDILISSVTLIGMLLFLMYLSTEIFYFVVAAIAFGAISFQIPVLLGRRFFLRSRDKVEHLQEAIKGSVYGIKELKLCKTRRDNYLLEELISTENEVLKATKIGATIMRGALNYGDMIIFFVIGYVAFIISNYHAITQQQILGSIMVLLYITGPISILMSAIPELVQANISVKKANKLFADLPAEKINHELAALPNWHNLSFKNVTFNYATNQDINESENGELERAFAVGPLSFELNKGEVAFIVGGNGSGKSTLSKLITGHYLPTDGLISLDQCEIDAHRITGFRDQVSAVYSDYYLFTRLLGGGDSQDENKISRYLKLLQLEDKVSLSAGKFSSLSLSDGQRKRLALLVSFLEDKQLYLFDEWAADQDPIFKDIFYTAILPDLKAKKKLVVVISHDDRYFHVADKMLVMEQGKLVEPKEQIETKKPPVLRAALV
ncbi:cyclic peptide export ABC transporter [Paraglaciecola sp.]|uniref:cyclic peptide export ABC transporter n=1 Tax=Paraglaciecola sp. TaxID=1920173 RepID=UPI0030F49E5D